MSKKASEHDQEMPQSHHCTTRKRYRALTATQQQEHKEVKKLALSSLASFLFPKNHEIYQFFLFTAVMICTLRAKAVIHEACKTVKSSPT